MFVCPYVKMNQTAASPLHDKDVRNAVAHIINYDSMAKIIGNGSNIRVR